MGDAIYLPLAVGVGIGLLSLLIEEFTQSIQSSWRRRGYPGSTLPVRLGHYLVWHIIHGNVIRSY